MEKQIAQLLTFILNQNIKKDGYVLVVSIAVLLIISSVLLYQYHYYQESQQLVKDLSSVYVTRIKDNLR